jgi:hypothetical protein
MKSIFNHKNPRHIEILREELSRAKRSLNESYSADAIWDTMTQTDRKEALYVAKIPDPTPYLNASWDSIPADDQDLIDLADYAMASDSQAGRSLIRGIQNALRDNPDAQKFVDKFLKKIGRNNVNKITVDQASKLNTGIWQYISSNKSGPTWTASNLDPRDSISGQPTRNRDWRGGNWTGD